MKPPEPPKPDGDKGPKPKRDADVFPVVLPA
jgi:hypothetical protein